MFKINLNKTIFWVGAGVSVPWPSKLPGGQELTEYYLSKTLGKECANIFLDKWRTFNQELNSTYNYNMPIPRLEVIIGCIDEIDKEFDYIFNIPTQFLRMISGFETYRNINPNINHLILNYVMEKHNSIIVTPNFDLCIENITGSSYRIDENISEAVNIPVLSDGKNAIFHYHGIGGDDDGLGATLSKIKDGLTKDFGDFIVSKLNEGYSIITVGFSMSDYFDVSPFFDALHDDITKNERPFEGNCIFFQHEDGSDYNHTEKKTRELRHCFCYHEFRVGDTTAFLKSLLSNTDLKIIDKQEHLLSDERIDWTKKFETIVKYRDNHRYKDIYDPDILKFFYTLRLCNEHGLNISDQVSQYIFKANTKKAIERSIEFFVKKRNINIDEHITKKFPNDRNKSIIPDVIGMAQINDVPSHKLDTIEKPYRNTYQEMQVRVAAEELKSDIIKFIMQSEKNAMNFDTLSVYSIILAAQECIPLFIEDESAHRDHLLRILACIDRMLELPYNEFEYISYYLLLTRFKNIINEFMGSGEDNIINHDKIMTIALEICSIRQVLYNLDHLAYIHMIRYCKTGSISEYERALQLLKNTLALSSITGRKTSYEKYSNRVDDAESLKAIYRSDKKAAFRKLGEMLPPIKLETEKQNKEQIRNSEAYSRLLRIRRMEEPAPIK